MAAICPEGPKYFFAKKGEKLLGIFPKHKLYLLKSFLNRALLFSGHKACNIFTNGVFLRIFHHLLLSEAIQQPHYGIRISSSYLIVILRMTHLWTEDEASHLAPLWHVLARTAPIDVTRTLSAGPEHGKGGSWVI